jgi:mono/diheme cytochrome c family protein
VRLLTAVLAGLAAFAALERAPTRADATRSDSPAAPARASGAVLYDRFCLACHGARGDGAGPAAPWLWPRPRDFTSGQFKWRTTPSGAPPRDEDLAAAIRHGVPGTSMHPFAATLSEADIAALVAVIERFLPAAEPAADRSPAVSTGTPPAATAALVGRGQRVYVELGCPQCHGPGGRGDGPAAASLRDDAGRPAPPYDLTREPLRRPRPHAFEPARDDGLRAIYLSLSTGLSGTPMPSYQGAAPEADLWAVAAYVDSIRHRPRNHPPGGAGSDLGPVPPLAVRLDREQRTTRAGYWPGGSDQAAELAVWGRPLPLQGPAPATLAPAQASLDANRCARCHARQVREWRGSFHAGAGSPGLIAQLIDMSARGQHGSVESCQRCHAPLAEQLPALRPVHELATAATAPASGGPHRPGQHFDPALRRQGINCASCHLRSWQRLGPPRVADARLLALPGYPLTELALYERADFCLPCHQLPPRDSAVAGKPLLDTYREWLAGPYMRRGIQCQHCHMPDREHTWKGVHDPATFREGVQLDVTTARAARDGAVTVHARLANVGAGHYLPTTPTPAAWLSIQLVTADGIPIRDARREMRIGRHLVYDTAFRELADTRIPPGQSRTLSAAWKGAGARRAAAARVVLRVAPDEYYERFYERRLASRLPADQRTLFEAALKQARAAHYVALDRLVPIR